VKGKCPGPLDDGGLFFLDSLYEKEAHVNGARCRACGVESENLISLEKKSRELTYGGKPEHRFAYVSSRGVETSFL
jgi:hypothetical protein